MLKAAIIVAGGSGQRMHSIVPKQFLCLQGQPILMHTLKAFYNFDKDIQLITVLPDTQIDYWKDLCKQYNFSIPHKVTAGGDTRFISVKNGLALVTADCLLAVHDGVRPLVSTDTIQHCFECAEKYQAAIPVVDLVDSIRSVNEAGSTAADRTKYRLVQTPQVFQSHIIKQAYEQAYSPYFTDDASVVESYGTAVHLVQGNRENIKITTDIDLTIAEALLANKK